MSGSRWFDRMMNLFGHDVPELTWHDLGPDEGISESDRFPLDAFPFEWITTEGRDAMATWGRLRREGRFWPVIVGGDQELMRIAEQWGRDEVPAEQILAEGAKLDHPETLVAYREACSARISDILGEPVRPRNDHPGPPVGDWPDEDDEIEPDDGPSIMLDGLTLEPQERVHVLLMPAVSGWEVPALLRWGGWNECPAAEHHVAALRKWHEDYGAELVGLSGDVVELRVAKRPATRNEALQLAREHHLYCSDVFGHGIGDLATLAALLMVSDWWYFWWD